MQIDTCRRKVNSSCLRTVVQSSVAQYRKIYFLADYTLLKYVDYIMDHGSA